MKRYRVLLIFFFITFCLSMNSQAQVWSGIINPSRAMDWTQAGIPGGIPSISWTQCGSTITAYSGTATAINNAIAACGTNQFVLLGPGTFSLSTSISFGGKSNVVLRGSGADSTFIVPTGTNMSGNDCNILPTSAVICGAGSGVSSYTPPTVYNWVGGYAQGATSITLTGTSGINTATSGTPSLLFLNQDDDGRTGDPASGSSIDNGGYFVCADQYAGPSSGCSDSGASLMPGNLVHRWQTEVTVARSVNSGAGVVTIESPLRHPNWRSSQSPTVWIIPTSMVNTGVENLSINLKNNVAGLAIGFYATYHCWISGVAITNIQSWGMGFYTSSHPQIQNSYIYNGTGNDSYGIHFAGFNADALIVNNIIQAMRTPIAFDDGPDVGSVVAYNFIINDQQPYSNMSQAIWDHWAGNDYHLFEGNIASGLAIDQIHGTHLNETAYRNFFAGWESCANGNCGGNRAKDYATMAITYRNADRYGNIIANVMGTPGYSTNYKTLTTRGNGNAGYNLNLGLGNGADSPPIPDDPLVGPSTLIWGNYDTATGAVRWCGNSSDTGWSTTCSGASEVPMGAPSYPNSVPTVGDTGAGQAALPASFLYSSQPSWWGSHEWPPIGPDVTGGNVGVCSGTLNTPGQYAGVAASSSSQCKGTSLTTGWAGHVNLTPAMDCYLNVMGGPPDGTGSALTFSANNCYPASGNPTPAPPTGLTAVVQ